MKENIMRFIGALFLVVAAVITLSGAEDGTIDHEQISFFKPYPMETCIVSGQAFGGGMDAGKTYLTGERGPELITAGTNSAVTSNNDLQKIFDTSALENKMNSMLTALNSTNTSLTNMANGVNTLIAVESRALKAVEKTARTDRNQVGIV